MHRSCPLILVLLLPASSTQFKREHLGEASLQALLVAFNACVSVYPLLGFSAALGASFRGRFAFSAISLRCVVAFFSITSVCQSTPTQTMMSGR